MQTPLLPPRFPRRLRLWFVAALLLVLAGCGRAAPAAVRSGPLVAPEQMPAGVGRGFPTVASVQERATVQVGEMAPAFSLTLDDGRTLTMASLRGRPVIINHWATWCGPCRQEIPALAAAARAHPDLVIIAANRYEDLPSIQAFAAEFAMQFPVAYDPDGLLGDLYAVRGLPTSVFVDRAGRISAIWTGMISAPALAEQLAPL